MIDDMRKVFVRQSVVSIYINISFLKSVIFFLVVTIPPTTIYNLIKSLHIANRRVGVNVKQYK